MIAFHRVAEGAVDIWFMNSDGPNQRQITETFIDEYSPAWSPDGRWVVYTAGTGNDGHGTFDLWLMDSEGQRRRVVSKAANTQMEPKWRKGEHYSR
jgi:TolB protein